MPSPVVVVESRVVSTGVNRALQSDSASFDGRNQHDRKPAFPHRRHSLAAKQRTDTYPLPSHHSVSIDATHPLHLEAVFLHASIRPRNPTCMLSRKSKNVQLNMLHAIAKVPRGRRPCSSSFAQTQPKRRSASGRPPSYQTAVTTPFCQYLASGHPCHLEFVLIGAYIVRARGSIWKNNASILHLAHPTFSIF